MANVALALKQWWQKGEDRSFPKKPVSDELMQLFRLRREHRLLRVRVSGQQEVYQSMLVDIDLDKNQLRLDEPFPPQRPLASWVDRRVRVDTVEAGFSTQFEAKVVGVDTSDSPALCLAIPLEINTAQRRHHFRLAVDHSLPVRALIKLHSIGNVAADVLDLSARGIRLQVSGLYPELADDFGLMLKFERESPLECGIRVKNFKLDEVESGTTLVGGELEGLNPAESRLIERFLIRAQRMQRQQAQEGGLATDPSVAY